MTALALQLTVMSLVLSTSYAGIWLSLELLLFVFSSFIYWAYPVHIQSSIRILDVEVDIWGNLLVISIFSANWRSISERCML